MNDFGAKAALSRFCFYVDLKIKKAPPGETTTQKENNSNSKNPAIKEQHRGRRQPHQLTFVPYVGTRFVGGFDMGVARPNQRFGQHRNYKGTTRSCDNNNKFSFLNIQLNLKIKKAPTRETTTQAVQRYGKLL